MLQHLRASVVLLAAFTVLTGLAYPLAITAIGQTIWHSQANGSAILVNGRVVGSALIGQGFSKDIYFWPRPSAAGDKGYDGRNSSGSNFGPTSKALATRIGTDAARFGKPAGEIPADLLTASASGLDPDISPAAARFQVPRIAAARHLPEAAVSAVIAHLIERPFLGVIGEYRVNVLALNLALDALSQSKAS